MSSSSESEPEEKHRTGKHSKSSPSRKSRRRDSDEKHVIKRKRSHKSSETSEAHRKKVSRRNITQSRSRSRSESSRTQETEYKRERHEDSPPSPCKCLGVFGLSKYTDEKDLKSVFSSYGPVEDIKIICDRDWGTSKGFGFVYFENKEDAIEARTATQGLVLDDKPIRVDFSLTTKPHPPTPGKYLGKSYNWPRNGGRPHDFYDNRGHRGDRGYKDRYRGYNNRGYNNRSYRSEHHGYNDRGYNNFYSEEYGGYSYGPRRRTEYRGRRPFRQNDFDDDSYNDYEYSSHRRHRRHSPDYRRY